MASSVAIMIDPSIYTNYVNVHLSINKLDDTNYDTWPQTLNYDLRIRVM